MKFGKSHTVSPFFLSVYTDCTVSAESNDREGFIRIVNRPQAVHCMDKSRLSTRLMGGAGTSPVAEENSMLRTLVLLVFPSTGQILPEGHLPEQMGRLTEMGGHGVTRSRAWWLVVFPIPVTFDPGP